MSEKSLVDILRSITKTRLPRKTAVKVFQTRIWLENIFHHTGMNSVEFQDWYTDFDRESSNIVIKWLKGKTCVTKNTVKSIDKKLNFQSDEIFNLPLYRLLENKPLTLSEIKKLIEPFDFKRKNIVSWRFPNDGKLFSNHLARPVLHRNNSHCLAERGDIYGFIAILALVREAEAKRDCDNHLYHMKNLYRAFPAICRKQPFRRRWRELMMLIQTVHARKLTTFALIKVDMNIIEKQINAKQHIMLRERCPRDPVTGRFILPEDPVIKAHF